MVDKITLTEVKRRCVALQLLIIMGRAPRIEGENLWYHVFNRGNEKRNVFFIDEDRIYFLDLLFETAEMFNVEVHAYTIFFPFLSTHTSLIYAVSCIDS